MTIYALACRDCALGLLRTARDAKNYGNTREATRLVLNARWYWQRYIWELSMSTDRDFAWWAAAIAGEKTPVHETPECGYFKVRDRRGPNKHLAPIKRPWIVCAIWRDQAGEYKAELAGVATDVDRIWPYCARHPIPYTDYTHWHKTGHFPQEIAA